MPELIEQPIQHQPLRNLAAVRAVVWLVATAAAAAVRTDDNRWGFGAAAFGCLYAAITAAVPYARSRRPARLFDLVVDGVCSTLLVSASGGVLSPFSPILFLAALEAQCLLGVAGAAMFAFVSASCALAFSLEMGAGAAGPFSVLLSALFVETALLHRLGVRPSQRDTVLPERTVEQVESLLESVEEQNRRLRQSQKELSAAARAAISGAEDAVCRFGILSASLEQTDAEQAYRAVISLLKAQFNAEAGAIWALDYRGRQLEVQAHAGPVSPILEADAIPVSAETLASHVRTSCEQRLRSAVPQAPMLAEAPDRDGEIIDDESDRSDVIAAALRAGERIVGGVALACHPEGRFRTGDAARLAGLSAAAGTAVRSVERRASLQRGMREVSILHEMNLLVQTASTLEEIYEQIMRLAAKVAPFENCTVFRYLQEQRVLHPVATQGRQINLIEHIAFEHGVGVSAYVAGNRKPLFIPDLSREPGLLNAEMLPPRVRSFISVPMVVRDQLMGVINVSHAQANVFTHEEARVLHLLAGQAAMTIEREDLVRSLEQLAITDGLTGAFNHRYFQMRLENEVKRSVRYKLPFGLLMIDLDHFKGINDRFGHATGDLVLESVAKLLRECVRETDIVARYGGEEFALVVTQTGLPQTVILAERLRQAIADHRFVTAEGEPLKVTVSIGVAAFPEHGESREALLQASDGALYAAKEAGRNRLETA